MAACSYRRVNATDIWWFIINHLAYLGQTPYLFKYVNISAFLMNLRHGVILVFVDILKLFFRNDLPQQCFLVSNLLDTFHMKGNCSVQISPSQIQNLHVLIIFLSQTWKTRWFTLHRNELKYFKDQMVRNMIIHFPFKNQL